MICALFLTCAPILHAQMPTVSLSLPRGSDPVKAQVMYFLDGAFGGLGANVHMEPDRYDYDIEASSDGTPAEGISLIAYLPGCEFSAFRIDLRKERTAWRQVECVPLPTITLRGQISPAITANPMPELRVMYEGEWINTFFGIMDGMVPQWELARATPDQHGRFSIEIPNFCLQSDLAEASEHIHIDGRPLCEAGNLAFFLTKPKSDGAIAWLCAYDCQDNSFAPQPDYPDVVRFMLMKYPNDGLVWSENGS